MEEEVSGNRNGDGMPKEVAIVLGLLMVLLVGVIYISISPLSPDSIKSLKDKFPCYAEFMQDRLANDVPLVKIHRVEMLYACTVKASAAAQAVILKEQKEALGIDGR